MFAANIPSPGAPFSYSAATFSSYWEYRKNGSGAGWSGRGLQEIAPKSSSPTGDARRKKKAVRVRRGASIGLLPTRAVVFFCGCGVFFFFAESSCRGAMGRQGREAKSGRGQQPERGGGNGRPPPSPSYSPTQCSKRAICDDVASQFRQEWRRRKKKVVDTKKTGVDTQKRGSVRNKYRVLAEI